MRLALIATFQLLAITAVVVLLRRGSQGRRRAAGIVGFLSLLPLLVLGAIWPSAYTLIALLALPAFFMLIVATGWPTVLRSTAARGYVLVALVAAPMSSIVQLWWMLSCPDMRFIVDDHFRGEIRLVVDREAGLNLSEANYIVRVPPSGTVHIADGSDFHRCYRAQFESDSGSPVNARDLGVHWTSEGNVTDYRWAIE